MKSGKRTSGCVTCLLSAREASSGPPTSIIYAYRDDVDERYELATSHGAKSVQPPQD